MSLRAVLVFALTLAAAAMLLVASSASAAKPIGGCPPGWELVGVEELGITPETASGIPSLDGNGDALTCIMFSPAAENSSIGGGIIFRDNTVMGGVRD